MHEQNLWCLAADPSSIATLFIGAAAFEQVFESVSNQRVRHGALQLVDLALQLLALAGGPYHFLRVQKSHQMIRARYQIRPRVRHAL